MPRRILDFDDPDHFLARADGDGDERIFLLQAAQGTRTAVVTLENEQLDILAERVLAIIDELERRGLVAIDAGPAGLAVDGSPVSSESPTTSMQEEFDAGTLTIAWDEDVERVIIEARSLVLDDGAGEAALPMLEDIEDDIPDDAPLGPDVLRVRLRPVMAQRFARGAGLVVADGQPLCPLCGKPLDPGGHTCGRRRDSDYLR